MAEPTESESAEFTRWVALTLRREVRPGVWTVGGKRHEN